MHTTCVSVVNMFKLLYSNIDISLVLLDWPIPTSLKQILLPITSFVYNNVHYTNISFDSHKNTITNHPVKLI